MTNMIKGQCVYTGNANPVCVNSVKMPLVRVKFVKIPAFFVNSVKIHTGKKFYKNMFVGYDKYQVCKG